MGLTDGRSHLAVYDSSMYFYLERPPGPGYSVGRVLTFACVFGACFGGRGSPPRHPPRDRQAGPQAAGSELYAAPPLLLPPAPLAPAPLAPAPLASGAPLAPLFLAPAAPLCRKKVETVLPSSPFVHVLARLGAVVTVARCAPSSAMAPSWRSRSQVLGLRCARSGQSRRPE